MSKWTKREDELLRTLRRANVPYREKVQHFPGRTQDSLRQRMWLLRNEERMAGLKDERIGVWDIETSDWNADAGFMLGWAIYYPNEEKTVSAFVNKKELANFF